MDLFVFKDEDWNIEIKPEVLLLKVFKDVWDKYKNKDLAHAEFAYIYLVADFQSDFSDIHELEDRKTAVLESLTDGKKLKLDEVTEVAMKYYEGINESTAILLLKDMKFAIGQLRRFFREVDLMEETEKGALKYDISKLTTAIKSAPAILKTLNELEDEVRKGIQQSSNIKGGRSKGLYED